MWLTRKNLEQQLKAEFERGLALGYLAKKNLDKMGGGILARSRLEKELDEILKRKNF